MLVSASSTVRAFVLLATCLAAGLADAAPLCVKEVPASATWLAHVDVEAMRASAVVQKAYRVYQKSDQRADAKFEWLRRQIGMDVRSDLQALTVYGTQLGARQGVLVLHAEIDAAQLVKRLKERPDYTVATHRTYDVHRWTDAGGSGHEQHMAGAFAGPKLAIFASTAADLHEALDAVDDLRPRLAGDSPLARPTPAGTMLVVRVEKIDDTKIPFKSPLVTQSQAIELVVAEHEGELLVQARLTARSPEAAEEIRAVLAGLVAMATMQSRGDDQRPDLLRRLKLDVTGDTVTAEFRAPVAAIESQIERLAAPSSESPE
jgi:hypothetical protein